ncbi:major capsid protein [Salinivibrio sp. VYel4]|uniref:major capsid protein n=1 Tax=Salinivibrio sp. VYel4 TaxID=2490491 RepID=UPI00128BD21A|nr:major capsid protein [Salinivibrio sp. VYel4]MPY01285.1 hypothetical protein [Salinivibrio sp. VYel4]
MKKLLVVAAVSAACVGAPAFAAGVDTTAAVEEIGQISTAIVAVGGALIGAAATAVSVKWVKGAIFG